jgi:1-acyl-sn-glycerol-3-phosphate acyltransferase
LNKKNQHEYNRLYGLIRYLLKPMVKIVFGLKVEHSERFPEKGGIIVAPNHVSNFDPVMVGVASPRQLHFLAKAELFKIPVFSTLLRKCNSIALHRKAADRNALVSASRVLNDCHPLLVFPEGTRSKTGEIQQGKRGIGMLAIKSRVDVLPVYISGTFRLLPFLWTRRVVVRFGQPIVIEPFLMLRTSSRELYRKIGEETMNRIKELRDAYCR